MANQQRIRKLFPGKEKTTWSANPDGSIYKTTGPTVESLRKRIENDLINNYTDISIYSFEDILPLETTSKKRFQKTKDPRGTNEFVTKVEKFVWQDLRQEQPLIDKSVPMFISKISPKNFYDDNSPYTFGDVLTNQERNRNSEEFKQLKTSVITKKGYLAFNLFETSINDKKNKIKSLGDMTFYYTDNFKTKTIESLWKTKDIKPNKTASQYYFDEIKGVKNIFDSILNYTVEDTYAKKDRKVIIEDVRKKIGSVVNGVRVNQNDYRMTLLNLEQGNSILDYSETFNADIAIAKNKNIDTKPYTISEGDTTRGFTSITISGISDPSTIDPGNGGLFNLNNSPAVAGVLRKKTDINRNKNIDTKPYTISEGDTSITISGISDPSTIDPGNGGLFNLNNSPAVAGVLRVKTDINRNKNIDTKPYTISEGDTTRGFTSINTFSIADPSTIDPGNGGLFNLNNSPAVATVSAPAAGILRKKTDMTRNEYFDTKPYTDNSVENDSDSLVNRWNIDLNLETTSKMIRPTQPPFSLRSRWNSEDTYGDGWYTAFAGLFATALDTTLGFDSAYLAHVGSFGDADSTLKQLAGTLVASTLVGNVFGNDVTLPFSLPQAGVSRINRPFREYFGLDALLKQNLLQPSEQSLVTTVKDGISNLGFAEAVLSIRDATFANEEKAWTSLWTNNSSVGVGESTIGWISGVKVEAIQEPFEKEELERTGPGDDRKGPVFTFAANDANYLTPTLLEFGWKRNTFLANVEGGGVGNSAGEVSAINIGDANVDTGFVPADGLRTGGQYFPFFFQAYKLGNWSETMSLQATITDINENYSPSWDGKSYFGRTEKIYTYIDTERSIDFKFLIIATSMRELQTVWERTNWLAQQTYAEYSTSPVFLKIATREETYLSEQSLKDRMQNPPLLSLTIGNFFVEMKGFIKNLSFNWSHLGQSSRWEMTQGLMMPQSCEVSMSYQVLSSGTPDRNSIFYGIKKGGGVTDKDKGVVPQDSLGTPGGNYSLLSRDPQHHLIPAISIRDSNREGKKGTKTDPFTGEITDVSLRLKADDVDYMRKSLNSDINETNIGMIYFDSVQTGQV